MLLAVVLRLGFLRTRCLYTVGAYMLCASTLDKIGHGSIDLRFTKLGMVWWPMLY